MSAVDGEVGAVRPKTVALLAAVATIAVALNLRPAVVAVSPLLDTIRSDTGLSAPLAGLLTTLPLICFGIFSPVAPRLARRIGSSGQSVRPWSCWLSASCCGSSRR